MADATRDRTVGELMTTDVLTTSVSDTVAQASEKMLQRGVGSVVVVEGDKAAGILTERDLVRVAAAGVDLATAKVSDWMTPDPDVVSPGDGIRDVFIGLSKKGYRHSPVVEDGRLVGIVSMRDILKLAQILRVEHPGAIEARRGLEGVVVAETSVGDVRGMEGFYHYRQYNAVELAEKRTLEDVWHLLYEGHLPSAAEREAFADEIRSLREIPPSVKELLPAIATAGDAFIPLDALRTAYSLLAYACDFKSWMDVDATTLRANAMLTSAVMPTLIMALYRLSQGLEAIDPHPDLPYAANYLYMLTGEVPEPDHARAIEQYLISTTDHGFNSSTFTARVITSTGADLGSAVVGAIGASPGPSTAAPPAGPSTCSTPSARPTGSTSTCGSRSCAATGSWASATASTRPTTPAR